MRADEPGSMFLCGVGASVRPSVSNVHGVTPPSADDAPPPPPPPRDLSPTPLRCAASCVAPSDPIVRNTCAETEIGLLAALRKKFVLSMGLNVAVS